MVKLFEVPGDNVGHIYDERRWGDLGCSELCMDVTDLDSTFDALEAKGAEVVLRPGPFDMGSGSKGKIAYIRDPDGTFIELVEIVTVAWLPASAFMRVAMPALKLCDRFL